MQQSKYIARLVSLCSENRFGQDAVEWAILTGQFTPCYTNIERDLVSIMGEPGHPETGQYDSICDMYREAASRITRCQHLHSPEPWCSVGELTVP